MEKEKVVKTVFEEVTRTIDKNSGEVFDIQHKTIKKLERDKFAMVYLKDISGIIGLNSKGEFKTLLALVARIAYDTNEVRIMLDVKEQIAKETELSLNSIDKAVVNLTAKKILLRKMSSLGKEMRGVYILNPKYFFKGEDLERAKIIQIVLQYELKGEGNLDKW